MKSIRQQRLEIEMEAEIRRRVKAELEKVVIEHPPCPVLVITVPDTWPNVRLRDLRESLDGLSLYGWAVLIVQRLMISYKMEVNAFMPEPSKVKHVSLRSVRQRINKMNETRYKDWYQ